MTSFILIIFMATSTSSQAGAASITQEFSSKELCLSAGNVLVKGAHKRGADTLVWGCFQK